MTVDAKAKDDMKRLIEMMNQGVDFDSSSEPVTTTIVSEGKLDPNLDPSVADMKRILMAFNSVENPVAGLSERADKDRELREALVTEVTDRGTRIGSWEIVINEDDQHLKSFDVTNIHTGEAIASDLTLYDAARGIASILNEGGAINSREIREILNTEAKYSSSRQDAALFKMRMESTSQQQRRAVMEDRYIESLEKAKSARVRLSTLLNG